MMMYYRMMIHCHYVLFDSSSASLLNSISFRLILCIIIELLLPNIIVSAFVDIGGSDRPVFVIGLDDDTVVGLLRL